MESKTFLFSLYSSKEDLRDSEYDFREKFFPDSIDLLR